MIQLLITPDMPALTLFVNGAKETHKKMRRARKFSVGVQIPLPPDHH